MNSTLQQNKWIYKSTPLRIKVRRYDASIAYLV